MCDAAIVRETELAQAKRWCELNRGGHADQKAAWEEMGQIVSRIGLRPCLWEWNRQRGMSARTFDRWWRNGRKHKGNGSL